MTAPEDRLCFDILRDVMADEPSYEDIPVLQGSDAFTARMALEQLAPASSVTTRSGAAAVLEAADRVGAHVQAVAEVRALHRLEGGGTPTGEYADVCYECHDYYPCPTVQILDRLVP